MSECKKHRHKSQKAAEVHIKQLIEKGAQQTYRLQVYICETCFFWHIGNRKKNSKFAKDKRQKLDQTI